MAHQSWGSIHSEPCGSCAGWLGPRPRPGFSRLPEAPQPHVGVLLHPTSWVAALRSCCLPRAPGAEGTWPFSRLALVPPVPEEGAFPECSRVLSSLQSELPSEASTGRWPRPPPPPPMRGPPSSTSGAPCEYVLACAGLGRVGEGTGPRVTRPLTTPGQAGGEGQGKALRTRDSGPQGR